jgi:hypothetical protein
VQLIRFLSEFFPCKSGISGTGVLRAPFIASLCETLKLDLLHWQALANRLVVPPKWHVSVGGLHQVYCKPQEPP